MIRDMELIRYQAEAKDTAATADEEGGRRRTTSIGVGTLEITSKKKEKKGGEATRADRKRTAATTAWPGSQPRKRDLPTCNLTL